MISDEPDEDADALDDEKLLEEYLGLDKAQTNAGTGKVPTLPDWPCPAEQAAGLTIDSATLAWFQARHDDWRREVRCVLRAWIKAQDTLGT